MKYFLILVGCIAFTTTSFSQDEKKTRFGIKTGMNVSMLSASINSNSSAKAGFHLGFYVRSRKAAKLHLITELYYSSQGQKDEYVTGQGNTVRGHTVTTLNAMNIPFLFEFGRVVTFQLGPQIGFLVSGKEKGTVDNKMVDEDLKSIMKTLDIGLALGLGIHPTKHLNLGARYNHGLTPVFNTPVGVPADYPLIFNRVLHFYAGWSF